MKKHTGTNNTTTVIPHFILWLILLCSCQFQIEAACGSCLVSTVIGAGVSNNYGLNRHHNHHHRGLKEFPPLLRNRLLMLSTRNHHHSATAQSVLIYLALNRLSTHFGCNVASGVLPVRVPSISSNTHIHQGYNSDRFWTSSSSKNGTKDLESKDAEQTNEGDDSNVANGEKSKSSSTNEVSAGMVGAIGIYKNFISPLLPPACRFLPTCSQYGVQAIEEFGPQKGSVLTAWRLLRCSPFGGKGYDPPRWPPVSYTYGSY